MNSREVMQKRSFRSSSMRRLAKLCFAQLKQDGWQLVNTRGSHAQYKHPDKSNKVTVPHPKKDLPIGTLKSIFKQAGWDWDSR